MKWFLVIVAALSLLGGLWFLLRREHADGVKDGRAAAVATQGVSNAAAQGKIDKAVPPVIEKHAAVVRAAEQTGQEAVNEIQDSSDLDGVLAAHGDGIDRLRAQAASQ